MRDNNYAERLHRAVDDLSLALVKSTLDLCRFHYIEQEKKAGRLSTHEAQVVSCQKLQSHHIIESRDKHDLTLLMYACLKYHDRKLAGDQAACEELDRICAWLLDVGASVWAEGGRNFCKVGMYNGRPVFARAGGKNIVEALGQANLPPSVQAYINNISSDLYDRFDKRVAA